VRGAVHNRVSPVGAQGLPELWLQDRSSPDGRAS
jgi:hypothetical protein